jgi:hypothetical protein|tara:strand:+ start:447 stop:674 length:228 start_codon:yes stop_codon:yes gene_type:complete
MSNFIKVEGNDNLVRDRNTNQIINTNESEYQQYIARRKRKKVEKEKALSVEEDLANLKSEMSEIKSLLKELVNGN